MQGGPYPSWLGGVAASIAASITHPLDLTKVRLQATGEKSMVSSLKNTWRGNGERGCVLLSAFASLLTATPGPPGLLLIPPSLAAGVFGLWDGLSGTLFRQMTYSMCRCE